MASNKNDDDEAKNGVSSGGINSRRADTVTTRDPTVEGTTAVNGGGPI